MSVLIIFKHHSDVSDPTLLEWIMETFKELVRIEPLVVLVIITIILVTIPTTIVLMAIANKKHRPSNYDDEFGEENDRTE